MGGGRGIKGRKKERREKSKAARFLLGFLFLLLSSSLPHDPSWPFHPQKREKDSFSPLLSFFSLSPLRNSVCVMHLKYNLISYLLSLSSLFPLSFFPADACFVLFSSPLSSCSLGGRKGEEREPPFSTLADRLEPRRSNKSGKKRRRKPPFVCTAELERNKRSPPKTFGDDIVSFQNIFLYGINGPINSWYLLFFKKRCHPISPSVLCN